MKQRQSRGMTLSEILVALMVSAVVMSATLALFVTSRQYFQNSTYRVDVQNSAQNSLNRLFQDIQESDPAGIQLDTTAGDNALLLLSARNSSNQFIYNNAALPYWQKWVAYYLKSQSIVAMAGFVPEEIFLTPGLRVAASPLMLVRAEGVPAGMPALPSTVVPPVNNIPGTWKAIFKGANLTQRVIPDIQTFQVNSAVGCGVSGNDVFVQIVTSKTYGSSASTLAAGDPASACSGSPGNWCEIPVRN